MKPIQTKHELQFDYFSENYHQFETDFYKWAATSTPLVFLETIFSTLWQQASETTFVFTILKVGIIRTIISILKVSTLSQSPLTRIYAYTGHHLQR